MGNFKKYMLLKLTNGGLIYEHLNPKVDLKNSSIKKIMEEENVPINCIKRGHNFANPIPYTTLSNMLTSMLGWIPVPTKPLKKEKFPSDINRPDVCDEMAKNSYYHITSPVDCDGVFIKQVIGDDGEYYGIVSNGMNNCGSEFMRSAKAALNSNRGGETILFVDEEGNEVKVNGTYNFAMLLRLFNDDVNHPGYKRMISFISELLNVDDVRTKYTFGEMTRRLYEMSDKQEYKDKVGLFYDEMKPLWDNGGNQSAWFYNIFKYGKEIKTMNTDLHDSYSSKSAIPKTYLRNNNGDKIRRASVDGEIIVPITDENVYNALLNSKGFCTFLDGGVCEITAFSDNKNGLTFDDFENEWKKIS